MTSPATATHHLRHHLATRDLGRPFGRGSFGAAAEGTARFFGTPKYLLTQSAIVVAWIVFNAVVGNGFDPYPFILLNLAFSTQAAYAAPLILLAQTRQADRDRVWSDADARHREELSSLTLQLLQQNTDLTLQVEKMAEQIAALTGEIHSTVVVPRGGAAPG